MPTDVCECLARNITSNVRELEGALHRLVVHANLLNKDISIQMAYEVLPELLRSQAESITINQIRAAVCNLYKLSLDDMLSSKRYKTVATARQIAMYISRILTNKSYPEIGAYFGNKDHATVLYAFKKIQTNLNFDCELKRNIDKLIKILKGDLNNGSYNRIRSK